MPDLTPAEVNDILRAAWTGIRLRISQSVKASEDKEVIFEAIRNYEFKEGDPNGEHDFAVFRLNGRFYYFSWDEQNGSQILTVGRVDEIS